MAEGGLLPPIIVELKAKATELKAGLSEAKEDLEKTAKASEQSSSRMGTAMQKAQGYGKALAFGLGGVAVAVGGFGIEAATAGEKVDAQLRTAIKNAGGSFEELEPKIDAADSKMRTFGYSNEETNAALTRLTVATKDPEKALEAVSVAADLARSRNIPLATATDLVAKAMAGQTGALTRMGINLPIAAGGAQKLISAQDSLKRAQDAVNAVLAKTPDAANASSKAHAAYEKAVAKVTDAQKKLADAQDSGKEVLDALSARVHGAASAYGDTLAGKVAAARAQLDNIGEQIGKKLIPVITTLLGWVLKVGTFLGEHKALLIVFGGIVAAVVVPAILAWAAAAATAAAATIAASWPILAIIAAVTALGVAIYELVTHWTQVWGAIKTAAEAVWNFLKGAWDWIAHIFIDGITSGVRILEQEWSAAWNGVKSALSAVWGFIKMVFEAIVGTYLKLLETELHVLEAVWSAVWGGIKAATAAVWGFLQAVWSWISGVFGGAVHGVLNGLGAVWSRVWGGVRGVAADVWGFLQAVWGGIQSGINWVSNVVGVLGNVFRSVFGGIRSAVEGAWNVIKGIFDAISRAVGGVINTVGKVVSTIGSVAGKIGNFLGFDNGGIVPGPKGKPMLAVVHGGEYVLSNDMLAGRQEPTELLNAQSANGYRSASLSQQALSGGGGGGGPKVTVIAQTNASPQAIASQVGWTLRAMA